MTTVGHAQTLLVAIWLTQPACVTTTPRPLTEGQQSEVFARIQVHEARIDEAVATTRLSPADEMVCPRARSIQFHAERICHLAEVVRDADASSRCAAARRTSNATRNTLAHCPSDVGPVP